MNIPKWPISSSREIELLRRVLDSPQWGGFHEIVGEFEQSFAAYQHCAHGIGVFNGTVSLEMMLEVCGIGPGDEVIIPAISFVSTATAVSRVGAIPVFVDIEPYSFNIDPRRVEEAIGPRTKAILAVHFGGPMCEIERLASIATDHNLILFEDAAHAQGSEWNGRRAGSFGLAASFSFQNGKVMTSGEGGMVTTNDDAFAEKCRAFANQGRDLKQPGATFFHHYTLGSNFRLTALQAAVLMAQFERVDQQIALRCRNESFLREKLSRVPGLTFQKVPVEVNRHSHYLLSGRIDADAFGETRDAFHCRMTAAGVPCTPFYPHTLYQNPLYSSGNAPSRVLPCPISEACVLDAFWFPHRALMSEPETIEAIAREIAP